MLSRNTKAGNPVYIVDEDGALCELSPEELEQLTSEYRIYSMSPGCGGARRH